MDERDTLLKEIGQVSFVLDDLRLYLDTHPLEEKALDLYQQNHQKRQELLKTYAEKFEPLTCHCIDLDTAFDKSSAAVTRYPGKKHWTWSDGPVPWDTAANSCCLASLKGGA